MDTQHMKTMNKLERFYKDMEALQISALLPENNDLNRNESLRELHKILKQTVTTWQNGKTVLRWQETIESIVDLCNTASCSFTFYRGSDGIVVPPFLRRWRNSIDASLQQCRRGSDDDSLPDPSYSPSRQELVP